VEHGGDGKALGVGRKYVTMMCISMGTVMRQISTLSSWETRSATRNRRRRRWWISGGLLDGELGLENASMRLNERETRRRPICVLRDAAAISCAISFEMMQKDSPIEV